MLEPFLLYWDEALIQKVTSRRDNTLAKKEMICPFSGRLCRNCAIYTGRHYFLCYAKNYKGSLVRERGEGELFHQKPQRAFAIPEINIKALDPFDIDPN